VLSVFSFQFYSIVGTTVLNLSTRYKNFSRIYYKTVRAAKKLHYSRLLANNAKNAKKTWNVFNELLGRNKSSESVEKIKANGQIVTDPAEIAAEFNGFFTSVRHVTGMVRIT
jgi:hypothetical protein